MNDVPILQRLAEKEPWRQGVGLPRNALDPTWAPGPGDLLCKGNVEWESGTKWWVCMGCGRVSSLSMIEHKPIQNPMTLFFEAIDFFKSKRNGTDPQKVLEQMAFVAGAALRYAAVQPDIGNYVADLVTK